MTCDICKRTISYQEFAFEGATRKLITSDAFGSRKVWETICRYCNEKEGGFLYPKNECQ